jgi:amino acid adenylation domain-containing protein
LSTQETSAETVGFRLSPQQQLLLEVAADPTPAQAAVLLPGEPDLREALLDAALRHEILRTTLPQPAGLRGRSQLIHDSLPLEWTERESHSAGDLGALQGILEAEARRPFDLDRGPLARALLLRGEDCAVLVLTAHAACADPGSLLILLRQILDGSGPEAAEPVQYADYAQWRHELIAGDDEPAAEARAFWTAVADELPSRAPILFARQGDAGGAGRQSVSIPIDWDLVVRAGERSNVSPALFLEAAWHALLARSCGASELLLAGWSDGRAQSELEDAVGPYAQPLPIRSRFEPETTFAEVLDQVGRAGVRSAAWQDYARAEDLAGISAQATAAFAHLELGGLEPAALTPPASVAPLLCSRSSGASRHSAELWYDPAVTPAEDATQLAAGLQSLLQSACTDPARPVAELALTAVAAREKLLSSASGPPPKGSAAIPVHELFARQTQRSPDAPAVADAGGELSFAELDSASNRLAGLLGELGVVPGATVGLCMERTAKLLTAVLAVLKAGGAYVPLNHEHPSARLVHQLRESRAAAVLTEEHLLPRLPGLDCEVVCVDRDDEQIGSFPDLAVKHGAGPKDLAYVMYTSGSTGLPKGVAVTHGNLANYAASIVDLLAASGQGLRFGVVSAISTDLGNTCIFPPLISGGCVKLISPEASMDADAMGAELGEEPLDVLKVTPSHLRALISSESPAVLPRGWLLLGGEALSWDLVQRIRSLAPECRIVNHYGPTETTVGCCVYEVEERREDCATVPIGRPLGGVRAYVLGAAGDPLPPGVPGELCIAGAGVAAGYVGQSGEAFSEDPFAGGRMYRTGDSARTLRDGTIEFLGRVDDQVKIRGFRIEPGEIESALLRHPAVRQAAVVPEHDERGEIRLVGYVASTAAPSIDELQEFLGSSLPAYMVPSAFAMLESLPFTASGKVDRRALRDLQAAQTRRQAEYVAPRDEIETEIAGIWSELLGLEQVGVFDEFFALGGHSLLATQAIMRIRRLHGDIPLGALLAAPTVADLAEVVRSATAARAG